MSCQLVMFGTPRTSQNERRILAGTHHIWKVVDIARQNVLKLTMKIYR